MKIGYIYQDEYPWDIRVEKFVESFAAEGIETHILSRNRSGLTENEKMKRNIYVHRLKKGMGPLSRDFLNFPAFFSPFWLKRSVSMIREHEIDLIIVRDLPLALLAYWAGKLTHKPVIMDMAENYPAMIQNNWTYRRPKTMDYLIRNPFLLRQMEKLVLSRMDGIFVVCEESRVRIEPYTKAETPIVVIRNTPRLNQKQEDSHHPLIEKLRNKKDGQVTLLYVGGLEETRGLQAVVRSIPKIIEVQESFIFVIIGKGTSELLLRRMADEMKIRDYILFGGWVEQEHVSSIIAESDIGIVPHYVTEHTETTMPNKIYDYMAQKKPIIVTHASSLKHFVEQCQCGLVYQDKDSAALADAVIHLSDIRLRQKMGESGYEAVRNTYNWEKDKVLLLNAVKQFNKQKLI